MGYAIWASKYKELENKLSEDFVNLTKSYLISVYGGITSEERAYAEEEFKKRFMNFYLLVSGLEKEIDEMSEEEISRIREETKNVYDGIVEKYKNSSDKLVYYHNKGYSEAVSSLTSNDVRNVMKKHLSIDKFKSEMSFLDDLNIEKVQEVDKDIDELYQRATSPEYVKKSFAASGRYEYSAGIGPGYKNLEYSNVGHVGPITVPKYAYFNLGYELPLWIFSSLASYYKKKYLDIDRMLSEEKSEESSEKKVM